MSTSPGFERLHERVQRWVWSQGWTGLRDAQERAVEPILRGDRDLVLTAATAAGKTEAAFLPIASRLLAEPADSVRALYVSPLKALINDQHRRLEEICRGLELPVHRWHGDVDAGAKRGVLDEPRGVLLITPESLEALFVLRGTRLADVFRHLAYVVVDEMHAFLGGDRGRQLQSLLHRLDLVLRRRVMRVGLSATLGDLDLARAFLRPDDPGRVDVIEARGEGHDLRLALRAYEELGDGARAGIAGHLFEVLRGARNLVFANGRASVEDLAARLRARCEEARLPNEFHPHHGSLSRALRADAERALRDGGAPCTIVCTSTLEMGIDVGEVRTVAQVGAPPSVAALRQRLGRSGRRGEPSILRLYVREPALEPDETPVEVPVQDLLREELTTTVAMVDLLLAGWCEAPPAGALFLSTLLQQVLSLVAQHSGVRADQAFEALCATGPFREVDAPTFARLLRAMGKADLLTQDARGLLLSGLAGERLIGDHHFFATFEAAEEYRVVHEGRELGVVPVRTALVSDAGLVLAGRPWRVRLVDDEARVIHVVPGGQGAPPLFEGASGAVDDAVRARMRAVLEGDDERPWLDPTAARLLTEARAAYARLDLARRSWLEARRRVLFLPWVGDRVLNTLSVALAGLGAKVLQQGMALAVDDCDEATFTRWLGDLEADGIGDPLELAEGVLNRRAGKYDALLGDDLTALDYAARALDVPGALAAVRRVLTGGPEAR